MPTSPVGLRLNKILMTKWIPTWLVLSTFSLPCGPVSLLPLSSFSSSEKQREEEQ